MCVCVEGAPSTSRRRLGMFIFTIINTSSYKDKIQSFKLNITDHGHVTRSVAFTTPPYKILPAMCVCVCGGGGLRNVHTDHENKTHKKNIQMCC